MYHFAVFDLDGTLAYTLQDLADAVNYALTNHGFLPYPTDDYRTMVGNGIVNLLKTASKQNDERILSVLKQDFERYYSDHYLDTTTIYKGGDVMLSHLQNRGIRIGVLSNKSDEFVSDILRCLYPEIRFDAMWGKKEQFPTKPDPSSLNALLTELGADKTKTVYIGDSNVDVLTARNGGIDFIGCSWGFRGKQELINAGVNPEKIVDNNFELEKMILGEQ